MMRKQFAIVCMCFFVGLFNSTFGASNANINEQIFFLSDANLTSQIYVSDSIGVISQITYEELFNHDNVACSPIENKIAFSVDYTGYRQVYVLDLMSNTLTNVTNTTSSNRFPAWSPDGTQLAFVTREGGNNLVTINIDGSNLTQLTTGSDVVSSPAWSPDGSRIAFGLNIAGEAEIYVINTDGANLTRITNSPGFDGFPEWSPDGNQIAFVSARNGNFDIFVMNPDGTNPSAITNDQYSNSEPAWSPDGGRIAFTSYRDDGLGTNIYVMNSDGSQISLLIDNLGYESSPCWLSNIPSQSVTSLTLVNADTDTDIRTLNSTDTVDIANNGISIRANTDPATVGRVVFSVDGNVVATDNTAPYTIAGENGADILPWNIAPGTYEVIATPYSGADGTGDAGTPLTVQLEVVNNP